MRNHDRQGFLEPELSAARARVRVGVVGLSGGGSHIVQQLAHLGFTRYALFDPKSVEEKHLHRMVGATTEDADRGRSKIEVMTRLIRGLRREADIQAFRSTWQDAAPALRQCDLVFGCLDTFRGRHELETLCRRYRIPYIDIGIDVFALSNGSNRLAGQVALSMPDGPCLFCLGVLNDRALAQEGGEYGAAGGRPQVVWLNGIVASVAIGLAVDLFTAKLGDEPPPACLSLDGNKSKLTPRPTRRFKASDGCPHYPASDLGDPRVQVVVARRAPIVLN